MNLPDLTSSSRLGRFMAFLLMRWRIVWLMAGGAEPGRPSGRRRPPAGTTLGLAALASWQRAHKTAVSGSFGIDASGIFGVLCQRTVAGFARHSCMLALALQLGYVGVAGFANRVPGELDGTSANVVHGGRAKMAILAEIRRDHRPPDEQERGHAHCQDNHHADQVLDAPQEVLHAGRTCNSETRCFGARKAIAISDSEESRSLQAGGRVRDIARNAA